MEIFLKFKLNINGEDKVKESGYSNLVLLAQNEEGYRNLLKLSSDYFLESKNSTLALDAAQLENHAEGLIALCGGEKGSLGLNILRKNMTAADINAKWYKKLFGEKE